LHPYYVASSHAYIINILHFFFLTAGEGTWTFDPTEPALQELAASLGVVELTPETCAETYAKTWNADHQKEE
jgi:hypothetical protein